MRIRFLPRKKARGGGVTRCSACLVLLIQTQAPPSPLLNKSCCSFEAVSPVYAQRPVSSAVRSCLPEHLVFI